MTTALAVIDMQVWMFRTPQRMAKLPALIAGVNRALAAAEMHGWLVYEIRTEWPNDRSAWSLRTQRDNEPVLLVGTRDVETVEGMQFPARREVVIKRRHSAFLWTDFEDRLKAKNIARLLITGCWLDGCVGLTAIDGNQRNIDTTIITDAVASIEDGRGDFVRSWADFLGDVRSMPLAAAAERGG